MTERIEQLREYLLSHKHHNVRRTPKELGLDRLCDRYAAEGLHPQDRSALLLDTLLDAEVPVILEGERIVATRTISEIPSIFTEAEWDEIKSKHTLHERGTLSNISADYATTIAAGLEARRKEVEARLEDPTLDEDQQRFLKSVIFNIRSVQKFIGKYEDYARSIGQDDTADVLHNIKTEGAKTLREALQLLRIIHFSLWESGCYHNTLGRFDQYIYPYCKADMEAGRITKDEAFELVEEFFLTCNKDSDLYIGMQQGDNGQSIVLAGRDEAGNYLFNDVSTMALRASYELNIIDPKINLRVDRNTPLEIFEMGAQLTKRGLGFPQYDNDDVVIPGLIDLGYPSEAAHDYVVAACWEFIVPGEGMEIPNIDALSFAGIVSDAVPQVKNYSTYEEFYAYIESRIREEAQRITRSHDNLYIAPAPFMSLLMHGTIDRAKDITTGGNLNSYGIHGTGVATAADSLAVIKKYYYEEKSVTYDELIDVTTHDFEGRRDLYEKFRFEAPKMGQDDDYVDSIAANLLNSFASSLKGIRNERGGIWRAGTGTAMYYISHATGLPATPDGRRAGEVIPANFSPSMFIRQNGPVSVIKSFSKPDLKKAINGGPLTIELDESLFRNEENVRKLAMLIRSYVVMGGHQLQLNTLNKDTLLDAKVHPELHRNLIVRVWGWSGYFVELDEVYQNHVINRIKYNI